MSQFNLSRTSKILTVLMCLFGISIFYTNCAQGSFHLSSDMNGGNESASMAANESANSNLPSTSSPISAAPVTSIKTDPCVASGQGMDYQVGPGGGQLNSIDKVPWENLKAGDTVRIFYRSTPYPGKFLLTGKGSASAPIRVCGVKGPNGERPTITGENATTRAALGTSELFGSAGSTVYNEGRGIVFIGQQSYSAFPTWIQIDGLRIQSAHPTYTYTYTSAAGVKTPYQSFGAGIWIERGQNITIADNEITDCSQGLFSRSLNYSDGHVTKNIRIAGNIFSNNGLVGDQHNHQSYVQSLGVIYEFNVYRSLKTGAIGNALKDRSAGVVVRYNLFEMSNGARAMDFVEAEDWSDIAMADPRYRSTFAYGNKIVKDGTGGSTIHYGGDHIGSEAAFRKGTLYFFNNTVVLYGGYRVLFQLSTTEEKAEVWNNIFVSRDGGDLSMRSNQDVDAGYIGGGKLNLGRNWISFAASSVTGGWLDSDIYHPMPGSILNKDGIEISNPNFTGTSNLIIGKVPPIDMTTLMPLPGSIVLDSAQAGPFVPLFQLNSNLQAEERVIKGTAMDLGAVEQQ